MEGFLEEVVLELSLEGHVRNQLGRRSGRVSEREQTQCKLEYGQQKLQDTPN